MPIPDTDLDMIPLPVTCLACGAADKQVGDVCPRCGLTDADTRALLRAAASAYNSAYKEATAGRFELARSLLKEARGLGIPEHPSVVQLQILLEKTDFSVAEIKVASDYRTARTTALLGRFGEAQRISSGIISPSPIIGELQRLCIAGVKRQRKVWSQQAVMVGVIGILGASLFVANINWRQQILQTLPVASPLPSPEVMDSPIPVTIPTIPSPRPTDYPYPERLARRYFNDALDARKNGKYLVAARLADAAAETGRNTYILPHALLLRAEIADTIRETDAPLRWSKIAEEAPDSPYAALGLLRAAERVQNITGDPSRSTPYLMELYQHYGTSYEARQAKKTFNFPLKRTP